MTKNRKATLYISRKVGGRWTIRRSPKVPKNLSEGERYILFWYEGQDDKGRPRKCSKSLGARVDVALIEKKKKEHDLLLRIKDGKSTQPEPLEDPVPSEEDDPVPSGEDVYGIDAEITTYLSNVAKLAPKTYKAYKLTLDLFRQSCSKLYMHEITKQDLQAFDTYLMEQGDDDRTRHNRIGHVVTFLRNKEGRRQGPEIKTVSIKVKYVESPPEAYTRQELQDLFRVSSEEDKALWRFFLGTGFRETEVSVAEKTDTNRDTLTIRVDEKPQYDFKPKDCEKRLVPVSDALLAEIEAGSALLFAKDGKPDGHLLRRLKDVAFKGGLNCGKCIGTVNRKKVSCSKAPVCGKWILHRFRKNFATDRHNAGASARKIQKWLGHSSLETTLRYLAVGEDTSPEVRNIVNGVHAGL